MKPNRAKRIPNLKKPENSKPFNSSQSTDASLLIPALLSSPPRVAKQPVLPVVTSQSAYSLLSRVRARLPRNKKRHGRAGMAASREFARQQFEEWRRDFSRLSGRNTHWIILSLFGGDLAEFLQTRFAVCVFVRRPLKAVTFQPPFPFRLNCGRQGYDLELCLNKQNKKIVLKSK